MRELIVGAGEEDKVLVARHKGVLRCVGNYCPHFNLPLSKSFMADDKVVCPFHNAAFSILTGEPEQAPALDGLPVFEVLEKEGKFYVKVPTILPKKQPMPMAKWDPNDQRRFVIIGGGAAGLSAAETLRQSDYNGEILILSQEGKAPYDWTLLTKNTMGVDTDKIQLWNKEFLETYGIDYKLNTLVKSINSSNKTVTLSDDSVISFDKLLIATGGHAIKPIIPGIALKNVLTLRNSKDQEEIKAVAPLAKKIVIIGSGFIGVEFASHMKLAWKEDVEVLIISHSETVYQ